MIKAVLLNLLTLPLTVKAGATWSPSCSPRSEELRFDCHPDKNATVEKCQARRCCWANQFSGAFNRAPPCYFPQNYPGFTIQRSEVFPERIEYYLLRQLETQFIYPAINGLKVQIINIGPNIARLKIAANDKHRYEVPFVITSIDVYTGPTMFEHEIVGGVRNSEVTGIRFRRKTGDRTVIFDSSVAPLIYSDQFIQLSTKLPSQYVYGLGEHRTQFQISANWRKMSFWTRDQATVKDDNLYGNHPFLMSLDQSGSAFGYFMLNSNAMETKFTPMPAITYRSIGGIIDLFIFFGPSPDDVIRQYWSIVGNPLMPPYWSLGYHLSRWNYGMLNNLKAIFNKMKEIDFPYDVQWTGIDAFDRKRIFTYDRNKWAELPDFITKLHEEDMKYISIFGPGISCSNDAFEYATYLRGLDAEVYIRPSNNKRFLIGEVWPGRTVFPDWTHQDAAWWWTRELLFWSFVIEADGLWLDMNEVSSFVNGSVDGCNAALDNPLFIPEIVDDCLWAKTICVSALQTTSNQYNLHSLYGHTWATASYKAMINLYPNSRPFILTRSSFSGTGMYASKWGGDNFATFNDMYYSITDILNFNMFGFSQTGDDLCGFIFDTTDELCTRWHQLGGFYTFMRNHNNDASKPHDPTAFPPAIRNIMKQAVILRYRLLPFLYTCLYEATVNSKMPFNSLMFAYPADIQTHSIDSQFIVGEALMIAPVLADKARKVNVYFPWKPKQRWYEFPSGKPVLDIPDEGTWKLLDAPFNKTLIFIRSGSVIPTHIITNESLNAIGNRGSRFRVYAALGHDSDDELNGRLFWDNGKSPLRVGSYSYISMRGRDGILSFTDLKSNYTDSEVILDELIVFGVAKTVTGLTVNSQSHGDYSQDANTQLLTVRNLNLIINSQRIPPIIIWNYK